MRARYEECNVDPMTSKPWPPRTILVAVDQDASAGELVDRAGTLALLLGARLVVVHAVCVRADDIPLDSFGLMEGLEALDVQAHTRMAAWTMRAVVSGIHVSTVVQHGEPARVLVDAIRTEKAELVVLGAHRRSRAARALLGDLRAELAALGTCAVLSVPVGS
jgi:nucleotide-binding universal stress UspA family protein